jgi:tRNA (Thr-GGU) A37 N-methylase
VTSPTTFEVTAIGTVESSLTDRAAAPEQGSEGAPGAWLVFEPRVLPALREIRPGDRIVLLTWSGTWRRWTARRSST